MRSKTPELDETVAAEPAALVVAPPESESEGVTLAGDVPAPSLSSPSLGVQLIGGRYEILALLGAGGMGAVYRVRDTRLDELVALKILRGEYVSAPIMQRQFHDEVKLARKVTHRNVARTFDIGDHEGALFLTMELLDGESLGTRLDRERTLAINHAIDIALDVANGLGAAHAAGVIHRDLKPDNVFLAKDGRAVVTDFGIARAQRPDASGKTGGIVGTPGYMAPEQIEGGANVDGRTDLYALGEVLYEMITGERVWPAENAFASLAARLTQTAPDPRALNPDVSEALAAIIAKLLARKPEDRYATAAEVLKALEGGRTSMRPSHRAVETPALPRAAEAKGEKTIAVLPFKSHGAPDWVQQGLLEEIIDTLSMTRGLRVRPFGVVEPFVGSVTPARDVGRQLGVSVVIEGSVRAAGPDLRFSTRAIGVDDGFQIWAQKWQRPAGEILEVSDDAARAIAGALTSSLELPERGTQAPLAAEMYFRARAEFRGAAHARETIEKVVGLFDAAVSLAPKDPHVLAGAANAHARLAFFSRGEQITRARERAQEYADRAIAAAPHLGDPWVAIATLRNYAGDYAGAGRVLTSALKLAPNHPKARELLGRLMIELGDLESGNELLAGALALDPSCTDPRWDLSRGLALRGEIDRARALLALPCEHTALLQRAWMKLRLAMWFPDEDAKRRAVEEPIEDVGAVGKAVLGLKYLFTHGRISDATRAFLTEAIDNGTPRIRLMAGQTYAEYVAYAGEGADAVVAIVQRAADDALLDIAWIDGCPLLKDARKDPSWPALRRKVEERANAVRAAIRE